jgi:predicted MFS family arabinose efflux permease
VAVACGAIGLAYATAFTVPPLIATFVGEVGISHAEAGLLMAAYLAAYAVASPLAGLLSDRIGPPRTILAGLVVAAAVTLAFPLTSDLGLWLALRAAVGLALALVFPAALELARASVAPGRENAAAGWANAAVVVGLAAAFLATPLLDDAGGWRWPFRLFGLAALLGALMLAVPALRAPRRRQARVRSGGNGSLLVERRLVGVYAALAVVMFVNLGLFTWLPAFLDEHGYGGVAVGVAAMLMTLVQLPGALLGGWLGDRLQGPLPLVAAGLVAAWPLAALAVWDSPPFAVTVGVAVVAAFGLAAAMVPLFALPASVAGPARAGAATGLATAAAQGGAIVSTYLGGALVGATDDYAAAWALFAAVAVAGVVGLRATLLRRTEEALG